MRRSSPSPRLGLLWTFIDTLAILAWGILLVYYWFSGELGLLIHPRYFWTALTAGGILMGLAGLRIVSLLRSRGRSNARHLNTLPPSFANGLMLSVAVLGLVIPPNPLGSEAAIQQGFAEAPLTSQIQVQSFNTASRPEERTIGDWSRTLAVYPEPEAYAGQKVNVMGFVVQSPTLPDSYFYITRFVIKHCALDATPIGLPVALKTSREQYKPDDWYQVEGLIQVVELNGVRQVAIAPTQLTPIPKPKEPYEY